MPWLDGIRNIKWPLRTDAIHSTVYQEARRRLLRTAGAPVSLQPWKVISGSKANPANTWWEIDLSSAVGANPQSVVWMYFQIVNVAATGEVWNVYLRPKGTGGEGFTPLVLVGTGENIGRPTFRRMIAMPAGTGGIIEVNLNDADGSMTSVTYELALMSWTPENVGLNLA